MSIDEEFWYKKRVLITGHTGFKGSWLSLILSRFGCEVSGYALDPPTKPSLFSLSSLNGEINSNIGDIRDYQNLLKVIKITQPEIIFHMAAQSLVLESYKNPLDTYSVNVMGTVTLLDAIRNSKGIKVVINVTSDKCYENKEWGWGYRENDQLGGYDPYSNSKACSELITAAYRNSFFKKEGVSLSSVRAGNVIGGGDWAENRLIPDFIRALCEKQTIVLRNPNAIRPWQHVFEPLTGYLLLAEKMYKDGNSYSEAWNFGPEDTASKNVEWIARKFCGMWGEDASYVCDLNIQKHEASNLRLDSSKARTKLEWEPRWDIDTTLMSIVDWSKALLVGENMLTVSLRQIESYYK